MIRLVCLVAVTLSLGLSACGVGSSEGHPRLGTLRARDAVGTLIVDWSVRGTKDAAACGEASGTIDILVQDASGTVVGRFQQRCAALATSIPLRPGNYTATAALVDDSTGDRTTRAVVPTFSIRGNDEVTAPIDFPAVSFL